MRPHGLAPVDYAFESAGGLHRTKPSIRRAPDLKPHEKISIVHSDLVLHLTREENARRHHVKLQTVHGIVTGHKKKDGYL